MKTDSLKLTTNHLWALVYVWLCVIIICNTHLYYIHIVVKPLTVKETSQLVIKQLHGSYVNLPCDSFSYCPAILLLGAVHSFLSSLW